MKVFSAITLILFSIISFAQVKVENEVLEQGKVTIELDQELEIQNVEIVPLGFDENNEMTSYAVKRDNKNPLIIGIGDREVAILNAFVGAQLFFGVRAGIDLFDIVEFGVQANTTPGGNSDSLITTGKNRTGYFANIKIHPFKNAEFRTTIYAGASYSNIQRKTIGMGYYKTIQTGKAVGGHIGFRVTPINSRHSLGVEIGYEKSLNGLNKYEYTTNSQPISTGNLYERPTFNINYTIRLFK